MNPIFLDFETFYSQEYSLSKMTAREYICSPEFKVHGFGIAVKKSPPVWVTAKDCQRWLEKIVPGNAIVCHNAHFDCAILSWHYGLKPKFVIDTVSLSRALIGERLKSHSLDSISQFLLRTPKGTYLSETKGVRDLSAEQERLLAQYCLKDVDLCRQIFYRLAPFFPKSEFVLGDIVARMAIEPCLLLDRVLLKQYLEETIQSKQKALELAGVTDPGELLSNPKFAEALRSLGVEPPTKISPTTGKETFAFAKTDEGLTALQEHPDERVQALVAARLATKSTLAETRAQTLLTLQKYGPLPVTYLFSGATITHRLSGGGGVNLQNLPRGGALRRAILAPIRHTLVVGDLAQIELRITLGLAAELAPDPQNCNERDALNALATGEDLYATFASQIYMQKITKETHPLERQIAKSAVLGLGYGMGVDRFVKYCQQQGINIDRETAERTVKLFRGTYRGILKLWKHVEAEIKKASEPCGDIPEKLLLFRILPIMVDCEPLFKDVSIALSRSLSVKYPNITLADNELQYNKATGPTKLFGGKLVENLVQYLARQVLMEQLVKVNERYRVVMTTHDEIVCVVPSAEKEQGLVFVKQVMETSPAWWPSLPLNAEVKSNDRYGNAK